MKREWLTVSLLFMFKLHCVVGTSSKMFTESRSCMTPVLCIVSYASFGAMLCPFKQRYPWRIEILQYGCVVDVLYAFSYATLCVNLMYLLICSSGLCCRLFKWRRKEGWQKCRRMDVWLTLYVPLFTQRLASAFCVFASGLCCGGCKRRC
jgi:hypothetical protein